MESRLNRRGPSTEERKAALRAWVTEELRRALAYDQDRAHAARAADAVRSPRG